MSVICVIPARYQSSRFPGKRLVQALGKSVLQRTYESALGAGSLDAIYVATDHEEIRRHVEGFGGKVLWTSTRPVNGTERISALYFSRSPIPYHSAGAPIAALAHLGIYCYRPSFLQKLSRLQATPLQQREDLEQLQFLEWGYKIQVALVEKGSLGVDVPQDLVTLEEYLCR